MSLFLPSDLPASLRSVSRGRAGSSSPVDNHNNGRGPKLPSTSTRLVSRGGPAALCYRRAREESP